MKSKMKSYKNFEEYLENFPKSTQAVSKKIRATIKKAAPEVTEAIKYGIPTFVQKKNLVHFAAYDTHIGFYPGPSAILKFKNKLKKYKTSKGAIRFEIESVPHELIGEMVKSSVKELK